MPRDRLAVDRLPDPGAPLEVVLLADATFGADAGGARAPHRHDHNAGEAPMAYRARLRGG